MASQTVTMKRVKEPVTKKPSGLTLTRNGQDFTASWKIADSDYGDGQSFAYRIQTSGKWGKWTAVSVGKTTTARGFSVTQSSYYPTTSAILNAVAFRVCGNRKKYTRNGQEYNPTVSEWSKKTYSVKVPNKPTLTAALSSSQTNVCTFSWSVSADANAPAWAHSVEWEARLVKNCNETNGDKVWNLPYQARQAGTNTNLSSSVTITEDTATLSTGSFTRWMRIRSRGVAGASAWVYKKHVYATPKAATGTKASATTTSGGLVVSADWTAGQNAANPIGSTTVQYAIEVPAAGLTCPANASWTDANVSADTAGKDATSFAIGQALDLDECLFVRVNTKWDSNITYGTPTLAKVGALKPPTGLSVSTDDTTYRATITATNASEVPDSFLVVVYMTQSNASGFPIGIIPAGGSSVTVQCPAWDASEPKSFGVYAAQGSYTATTRADGVTSYAVSARMRSEMTTSGGSVPVAPGSVALALTDTPGTIRVTFSWTWTEANAAELSWSDHADAWESTDEPSTYIINSLHASRWHISGLETGITWYVRVRLLNMTEDATTYGAYSNIVAIDLSSAPAVSEMYVLSGTITEAGTVTAAWTYVSTDGTGQSHAEVAEVVNGAYVPIAHAQTAQHVDISAEQVGWAAGETHMLAVQVTSASGNISEWCEPVPVAVVEPLTASIDSDSLVITSFINDGVTKTVNALQTMPLTVTVTGAGVGGTTSVAIERAETYTVERPDESELYGFEGETVAFVTQIGEDPISITDDMLIGSLDDGAAYRIVATISDGFGQRDEVSKGFEVHWTHQAAAPTATATIDDDLMIARLTPTAPSGAANTDVCDIYRLSVDKPTLIYSGATFGTTYVDPYPTIGEFGGHRFVTRTANGDYITEDDEFAWIDLTPDDGDLLDAEFNIIDFGRGRVYLLYEINLSNSWKKDFTETKYLGGSIQGDWNPAVSRNTSVSSVAVRADDQATIESMRRLATWPGICHVRTKDGSSFAADVQVKEDYKQSDMQTLVYFSLSITRVDPDGYEGMTLAEWEATQQEED